MSKSETSTSEQAGDSNSNDHDCQKINGSFEKQHSVDISLHIT